jgi:hypothetical protein
VHLRNADVVGVGAVDDRPRKSARVPVDAHEPLADDVAAGERDDAILSVKLRVRDETGASLV